MAMMYTMMIFMDLALEIQIWSDNLMIFGVLIFRLPTMGLLYNDICETT